MNICLFYVIVILMIAIPHSLFEVWMMDHFNVGWNEKLPQDKWWAKNFIKRVPFDIVGTPLLSRYHFIVFVPAMPTVSFFLAYHFRHWAAHPPAGRLEWTIFTVACWVGAPTLEDFLFFVWNTIIGRPYPHAFTRMIHGEAEWHTNWKLPFSKRIKLPMFYYLAPVIVTVLLLIMRRI